jgi:hypothetical protein
MQHNLGNNADIFLLVKGLSSNEKSYYKKMAKRHADQNGALHLKLFKLIDASEVHNEHSLCEALNIENKIHFSCIKSYLHKDILDILVFQKRNNFVDTQLYFMQDQIRGLQEKKLLYLAQKLCKKAIALAEQYEKYRFLVLLLHLENQVLQHKDYRKYRSTAGIAFAKLEAAINRQQLFSHNRFLFEKVSTLTHWSWLPITEEELSEINKAKELLKAAKPANDQPPLILLYYLNTLALCQYMLHENKLCTTTCAKLYNLWKSFPHLINEEASLFLKTINTTCYNDFLGKDIQSVKENISAYAGLVNVNFKNEIYRKHFEVIRFNTELKIYLNTAQFDQAKILVDHRSGEIFSYSCQALSPADQLSVISSVCIFYFVLEQWEDSENLLSLIKEKNQHINREDILYFSLLFYILILYERKEWGRLDSTIEASYHFLYARKKLRIFERELMLFFKRLSSSRKANPNELIKNFLAHLDNYKNDPDKNLYFLYFNYYGWLESKLLNLRYMDYIRQQVQHS